MKLAVAQIPAVPNDLAENIDVHLTAARVAANAGADFLIFPELSLTSYSHAQAEEWQTTAHDPTLQPLQNFASGNGLTLVAGAPIKAKVGKPYIGSIIFGSKEPEVYLKYHLDPGEVPYFQPGATYKTIDINRNTVGCAICADLQHESLAAALKGLGADVYALSAFITPNGYARDADILTRYARNYGMTVMLSNFSNMNDGISTAGKSAIWAPGGNLVVAAKDCEETVLIAEHTLHGWQSASLLLP